MKACRRRCTRSTATSLRAKSAAAGGRIARLLGAKTSPEKTVEDIYLATLSRYPTQAERQNAVRFLKESKSPRECFEDLQWALINSKEFLFVH